MAVSVVDVQVRTGGAVRELNRLEQASRGAAASIASLVSTLGAGFALQQIVRTTSQFESVLSEIGKTAGASEKEITKLAESLKQLSAPSKTNLAPTVLAEGVKDLVAQGLKLNDAVASMETLGKVAVATNSELTDVTKTGFQLQSALKIRPNELKETFDALAFAGKAGAFELKDMAQFMPTIASAATSLGIRGKEGAVALAAMMQMVRKDAPGAAEASTRLTDALLKMTAPETVKNFKKFGVDIEKVLKDAVAKGVNPMDAAIKELIRVTGKDSFKLSQIFGDKEAKLALMALMKYKKEYEDLKAAAGGAAAAGTVQKDFEASLKTFNGQLQTLQSSGELLALSLGRTLLPVLSRFIEELVPLANGIAEFVQGIGQLPKPVLDAVVEITKLVIQITLLKKVIGLIVGAAALFKGAMALMAAQTTLVGAAALTGNAKLLLLQRGITGTERVATALATSLKALARLGLITVAIKLAIDGLEQFIQVRNEINRLRGQREKGGAAAVFAGAAPVKSKQTAQKTLQQIRTEQKTLQSPAEIAKSLLGPLAPLVGGMSPAARGERGILLKERAAFAQGVLALPTRLERPSTTPSPDAPSGTGIDPLAKQKMGKKEKDILEITKQERDLRLQLNVAQLQQNKEQEAFYTRQLALLDISQKKIGVNQRESEIFAVMVQYNQTMKQIQEEQANNTLPKMVEKLSEAASGYSKNLDLATELTEQQKQQKELADGIAGTIGGGMASAFDALIQGSQDFGASLRQIASGVLIDIANQLLRIFVINQAINAISGLLGPKTGGTGGFLPNVKFNPVAFSGINLRAMGGSVTAGQPYLVGERGPELFMPGRSGGIAPAGGFGGGANIVVNVDANGTSAGGDSSKAGQLGKVVAAAVQAELVKQRRPGGILA